MRRAALLLLPVLVVFAGEPAPAAAAGPSSTIVEVIKVEGAIDRPLLGYLDQKLAEAESEHAVVVLQLNTAGTLDEDAVALAQRVADMTVPVISWIGPAPSRASGAGMLLLYASAVAAVYPGSQTGPLYPLDLAHPDRRAPDLTSTIHGWLQEHGRTAQLVFPDGPKTGQQAVDLGVAQFGASSIKELLDHVDRTTVRTAAGPVTLHTRIAVTPQQAQEGTVQIRFNSLGPVKRLLHGVSTPSMIYFLLLLGLAALAFEITQTGFGFAGIAGVGMLALAVYGLTVVPVSAVGLGLILAGVGALVLDVRLRRLGPLTGLGLAVFVVGSILAWHGVASAIRVSPWLIGAASLATLLYYGFGLTVALQSRERIVGTQRGLIGLVGETRGRLAPEGPVFVKGAMWRGRSANGEIPPGTKVRVRGLDGLILRVEPEPDDD